VRALQAQRRAREEAGLFVVEGVRLAEEALKAGCVADIVLHRADLDERGREIVSAWAAQGSPTECVSPSVMEAASDDWTPPGLLAAVQFPRAFDPSAGVSFVLILDRISDPGNLGTILRTADAAGVEAVFLTPGTVDPFNAKVVRAGMGAHFHVPICQADCGAIQGHLEGFHIWAAEAREGTRYDQADWRGRCAILIGSEATGPSPEARALANRRVFIPMPGQAESLNAAIAAGVLVFEAARCRSSR
jgi:RNA methyltransferase, TrmH family